MSDQPQAHVADENLEKARRLLKFISSMGSVYEEYSESLADVIRRAAGAPAETPKPVAWSVGLHLFHSYDEALRSVRNPDLKPEPLYAAQPAPAPATDARDGERYRWLRANLCINSPIRPGNATLAYVSHDMTDSAVDAAMLSANSPREAG